LFKLDGSLLQSAPGDPCRGPSSRSFVMNGIIYLVGLVVIVLAVLSLLGLR
jgi:hypothetical protein